MRGDVTHLVCGEGDKISHCLGRCGSEEANHYSTSRGSLNLQIQVHFLRHKRLRRLCARDPHRSQEQQQASTQRHSRHHQSLGRTKKQWTDLCTPPRGGGARSHKTLPNQLSTRASPRGFTRPLTSSYSPEVYTKSISPADGDCGYIAGGVSGAAARPDLQHPS